jgi:hypothetical protein
MKRLINAGADVNSRNNVEKTPLDYAKDGKKLSAIKILVQKGAEVTIKEIKEIEEKFEPKEIEQVFGVTELSQQVIEQVREEATKEQQREVTPATIEIMPKLQKVETVTYEQKELKTERAIIGQMAEEEVVKPTLQYAKLSKVNVVNEAATCSEVKSIIPELMSGIFTVSLPLLLLPVETAVIIGTTVAFLGAICVICEGAVKLLDKSKRSVHTEERSLLREVTGQQHETQYEMVIEKPLKVNRTYPEFNNEFARNTHAQDMRKRETGAYIGME